MIGPGRGGRGGSWTRPAWANPRYARGRNRYLTKRERGERYILAT